MRETLLTAVRLNARTIKDATRTRDNVICRAAERRIPQTVIAEAAGLSQAHVSRIIARHRAANDARKAARRSRRKSESGTV